MTDFRHHDNSASQLNAMSLKQNLGINQAPQPMPDSTSHLYIINLPIIGRIQFLKDKLGIQLISGIVAYWIYGVWSSYFVIIKPHYADGLIYDWYIYCKYNVIILVFNMLTVTTLSHFLTHYQMTNFRLFRIERQFQIWQKWQKVIQTDRKHTGKRRNCSFPQCFQKACFPGASKGVTVWEWILRKKPFENIVGKGEDASDQHFLLLPYSF